jgi:ABC-type nitrate/sulfonate/bicarbonate transport system substrate-binding protein
MGSFLRAALAAKGLTDDEADLKDILRVGAIAAAPAALSRGVTAAAGGDNALADF